MFVRIEMAGLAVWFAAILCGELRVFVDCAFSSNLALMIKLSVLDRRRIEVVLDSY